jgi:hypothetical protein
LLMNADCDWNITKLENLEFKGFSPAIKSRCHVTVFTSRARNPKVTIIICTQLRNYSGTSVTNGIEAIRDALRNRHNIPESPDGVLWFEHYPAGTGLYSAEAFTQVEFDQLGYPGWFPPRGLAYVANQINIDAEILEKNTSYE